jgi:predicted lactoylglutathione lyase
LPIFDEPNNPAIPSLNPKQMDTPKLGSITALTITSPDLEKSFQYWQKLGFAEVMRSDFPFPWIQVSDGALLIMLRKADNPYIALTYYITNEDIIKTLGEEGIVFTERPKQTDMVRKHVLQSRDGLNISLVLMPDGFTQPPGPTMLTMQQLDYFNPEKYVNKTCGMYGELAHPVTDLNASIVFWEKLGFKAMSTFSSPYPWAIVSDGLAVVGLHQTTQFSYPAITFFAADMKDKIARLKEQGLENFAEKGAGNIVLTTPENQHVNLFKMGF